MANKNKTMLSTFWLHFFPSLRGMLLFYPITHQHCRKSISVAFSSKGPANCIPCSCLESTLSMAGLNMQGGQSREEALGLLVEAILSVEIEQSLEEAR